MGSAKQYKRFTLLIVLGVLALECQRRDSRLLSAYKEVQATILQSSRQRPNIDGATAMNASLVDARYHDELSVDEKLLHSSHLEYLPLQDWELLSAGPERRCEPPDGVPDYCCLGSASEGGEVKYKSEYCINNHTADMVSDCCQSLFNSRSSHSLALI
jgi:hypothetical protein